VSWPHSSPLDLKSAVQRVAKRAGYRVERRYPPDLAPEVLETIRRVEPFTLTTPENVAATCAAAEHVVRHGVAGAAVECGVWRGGSAMAIALTLLRLGAGERDLYLFDTFTGMSEPGDEDVRYDGLRASDRYRQPVEGAVNDWAGVSLPEVEAALASTGYDSGHVHLIPGVVEETLPAEAPDTIALLRVDTDWYASTKHELVTLFPRLALGGVLLIDDYGHWLGARRAVDEYLAERGIRMLLHRVDYTARMGVKEAAQPRISGRNRG